MTVHGTASAHASTRQTPSWLAPTALGGALVLLFLYWSLNWWWIGTTRFDGWSTGDWLISYDGGFVRRGLFGSLVLGLTPESFSVLTVVTAIQIALMGMLFGLLFLLYLRTSRSKTWAMVLLSPAGLMFFALGMANEQAGPRKELLVMTALALVAMGFRRSSWFPWAVGGFALFTFATLAHEASALVLPAFAYLIFLGSGGRESTAKIRQRALIAAYSGVAAIAVVLAIIFPGNAGVQQAICEAWIGRGVMANCQGEALGSLTLTADRITEVFAAQLFPHYWEYLLVIALAALPLYAVRFLPQHGKATLIILAFLAPLFLIAWDYGRWILLAAMTLSILALALAADPNEPQPMQVSTIGILAYCFLWGFPGYANEAPVLYDGWIFVWLKDYLPSAIF